MDSNNEKEHIKRLNAIRFIEATQELIDAEGIEHISIRKIAEKAGFHNSTIYLYFKDVDQLILFASLKYFTEYSKALSELSTWHLKPRENFMAIWDFFAQTAFRNPQVFYNFFFGKYSTQLDVMIEQYYNYFPEERKKYSSDIEDMYYSNNIYDRCMQILLPIAKTKSRIDESNLETANDIMVSYLKYLLEQKCQDSSLDPDMLIEKLLNMLRFVID